MKDNKLFLKALVETVLKEADIAVQDIKKGETITPEKVKKGKGGGGETAGGGEYEKRLKAIFKQEYGNYVTALGKFASDPKFQNFVKGNAAMKSTVTKKNIPVTQLMPTQNEIDVDGSLKWPLTKKDSAEKTLKGGAVMIKAPIISFNGKYIIDGHHRWSQLYAMNKDAQIVAYDFTNPDIDKPLDALKVAQLAIVGAGSSKIPSETVQGQNLLQMDESKIKKYVTDTLKDENIIELFKTMKKVDGVPAIADYIWGNVSSMKDTSQPVANAPARGIMPQADKTPGGQNGVVAALKKGLPAIKETEKTDLNEVRKLQQIAGLRRRY